MRRVPLPVAQSPSGPGPTKAMRVRSSQPRARECEAQGAGT